MPLGLEIEAAWVSLPNREGLLGLEKDLGEGPGLALSPWQPASALSSPSSPLYSLFGASLSPSPAPFPSSLLSWKHTTVVEIVLSKHTSRGGMVIANIDLAAADSGLWLSM